ncbi:MAG: hypothetical protein RJA57_608, partial [Bacteroidota bacterium]
RSQFIHYFPDPEQLKKRRGSAKPSAQEPRSENPYSPIIQWFDKGNTLNLSFDSKDAEKIRALYQVDGLHALVKKIYPRLNEDQTALLMEFVLHGLAAFSLISKKMLERTIEFRDLMGSMVDLKGGNDFEYDEEA